MDVKIFHGFGDVLFEVSMALIPLLLFFFFFQVFMLKLPLSKVRDIIVGVILTFFGLAFFLQGVHVGFLPVGQEIGDIVGDWTHQWILIPVGFLLGFVATFAEPAVRVLNAEVDKVTSGYIPSKLMLYTLSIGVAISIALSMARIIYGIPLWYFIGPGYILALSMILVSNETFTSIAFDAGGVATGPMTVTFILAIALGFSDTLEGRDPLIDGFGMIALVALAPILSVLVLGLLFKYNESKSDG
ncbi:MAG: DUF1538 domain-containing protein [Balneolaceae bacterium]|nr:DUF1538 domain-containing protein [Balneolaceae bacterium]MCH8548527.1 DUF1538 domain-containing protein [Balneolaceae bacterium]